MPQPPAPEAFDIRRRRRENLRVFLKPRHIAFIGGRHLDRCIPVCRALGFEGDIWPVHPSHQRLGGVPCLPSLEALPCAPDASFVALSREQSIQTLRTLAAMGAAGAVCHVAGFGELGDAHRASQQVLAEACGPMAVVGPNCMGVVNAFDRVALWGDGSHVTPVDGAGVALVSQSGAFLYGVLNVERAYPMGYGFSVGNQAVIDTADLVDAVLDDERVRAVGIYSEGLSDGPALAAAFARAQAQGVPVVLLRGGGTAEAAQRSLSHTGNLAVPNDFWRALIRRYGLLEVRSPKQLVETTKLLAVAGTPRGPRLFVAAYSGAAGTLLAEQAPEHGLRLPPVSQANHDKIRATLPEVVTISNPLDLNLPWTSETGVSLDDAGSLASCIADACRDETDTILYLFDVPRTGAGHDTPWLPSIDAAIALRARTGLPTVCAGLFPEGIEAHLRERLLAGGVAPLTGFAETLEALGAAAGHAALRSQGDARGLPVVRVAEPLAPRALDEWQGKQLLASFGIAVPQGWVGAPEDAVAAATRLGFPVALKVCSERLLHKSRAGGVRLHLHDADALRRAVIDMQHDVAAHLPDMVVERVLVERMVENVTCELLVGIKRHPELGFALLVGRGGVAVEQLHDYALVLLPSTDAELLDALRTLRLALDDTASAAVLSAMRSIVALAAAHAGQLAELDVNPLLVRADGSVVAADALLVMSGTLQEKTGD